MLSNSRADSAYARSQGADEWSRTDHLLALVYDQLAAANWQRGGGRGEFPSPLPRPGIEPERNDNTVVSIATLRARMRRRREA